LIEDCLYRVKKIEMDTLSLRNNSHKNGATDKDQPPHADREKDAQEKIETK
jgi:hypothetical protein